jgi:hypothetical protein
MTSNPQDSPNPERGFSHSVIELLRLPEVQKPIAIVFALGSFWCAYKLAAQWTLARAMRVAPHDGMAGLGMLIMGVMVGVPTAIAVYFLSVSLLSAWERRYTQKSNEIDRLSQRANSKI